MYNIKFNKHFITGSEIEHVKNAMYGNQLCGDGFYTKKCSEKIEAIHQIPKALLTPSCTHALEMAALLIKIQPGDEVIMPSFTFVSTANAFALRGAEIVFVDINPNTMNIDERLIENAITSRTKAIVVVHYAGFMCEMHEIMNIAEKHNLFVIEDAAQAIGSSLDGKPAGSFGHYSALSFHETKNCTSGGEGGALLITRKDDVVNAEILREKGTNRSKFLRGEIDKYSWVEVGSSYLPSEIQAAYLYAQLLVIDEINEKRRKLWNRYFENLKFLKANGKLRFLNINPSRTGNGHIFCIFTENEIIRDELIDYLKVNGVHATFHYVPLHTSVGAINRSRFNGTDLHTSSCSKRLIRLPMYYELSENDVDYISDKIIEFFGK